MRSRRGLFIVLEGPDKSGKSTQAALLLSFLKKRGVRAIHTREPGGTAVAETVRKLLLDPRARLDPMAELLLYEAARAQHTREKIIPALQMGTVVVSERYTMASLAYQGFARGIALPLVRTLNRIASFGVKPDLCVVLDVPESEFKARPRRRALDRLERESETFRAKVRQGYRTLARREPRTAILDGRGEVAAVHSQIVRRLERLLS